MLKLEYVQNFSCIYRKHDCIVVGRLKVESFFMGNNFCHPVTILKSVKLIVVRKKSTLQDINTTPREPKTERGCGRWRLFRQYYDSLERFCLVPGRRFPRTSHSIHFGGVCETTWLPTHWPPEIMRSRDQAAKKRLKNKEALLTKILPTHFFRSPDDEPSYPPSHAISRVYHMYPEGQKQSKRCIGVLKKKKILGWPHHPLRNMGRTGQNIQHIG